MWSQYSTLHYMNMFEIIQSTIQYKCRDTEKYKKRNKPRSILIMCYEALMRRYEICYEQMSLLRRSDKGDYTLATYVWENYFRKYF